MKKQKIDITEQQNCIEAILKPLIRRNIDYNPIETVFEKAMQREGSIRNFLNPLLISNKIEECLIELKSDKEAQNVFMEWTYNRLTKLVFEWSPYAGSWTGKYLAESVINDINRFYAAYNYYFFRKENPNDNTRLSQSSDLFDYIGIMIASRLQNINGGGINREQLKRDQENLSEKDFEFWKGILDQIKSKTVSIKEDLSDSDFEYRNTDFSNKIHKYVEEQDPEGTSFQRLLEHLKVPSKNETELLNCYWEIIEELNRRIHYQIDFDLSPKKVREKFLIEKDFLEEIEKEELESGKNGFSTTQKIMIMKSLGMDDFLMQNFQITQSQYSKILESLIGAKYKTIENNLRGFKGKIKKDGEQINEDRKIVFNFFDKMGLKDVVNRSVLANKTE